MPSSSDHQPAYRADASLGGKLRRRWTRLVQKRPSRLRLLGPMVSFSFDDAPVSAVETGSAILEAAGVHGTYYISAGLYEREGPMGAYASEEQVASLAERGHEIGCHTFTHLDCGRANAARILADIDANRTAFNRRGLPTAATFAYPYGDVSTQAKRVLGRRFRAMRALHEGVITSGADLNQLPAVGIEGPEGEATAAAWLDRALAQKAWLILYTHDVAEEPSPWGCTPCALRRLVERATAMGFEICPVAEALDRLGAAA